MDKKHEFDEIVAFIKENFEHVDLSISAPVRDITRVGEAWRIVESTDVKIFTFTYVKPKPPPLIIRMKAGGCNDS